MIDIFEHPSWGPTSMQIWVGGQNFSFPTLFDSYRELLLITKQSDVKVRRFSLPRRQNWKADVEPAHMKQTYRGFVA